LPKVYAVYRPLYGEDFIYESIKSILPYVDKVFFCYSDKAFGDVKGVDYKGLNMKFPLKLNSTIDDSLKIVRGMRSDKIVLIKQDGTKPDNQFTDICNNLILPKYDKPDYFLFIEPDHIFDDLGVKKMVDKMEEAGLECAMPNQIELWRTPDWCIPYRFRITSLMWSMKDKDKMPPTGKSGEPLSQIQAERFKDINLFNMGFCVSSDNMFLKHLLSIAFSKAISDSIPWVDWFEKKWLSWDPLKNNHDLEISERFKHLIPHAEPFDKSKLPSLIKEKYGYK
jgi:hypothetical protein